MPLLWIPMELIISSAPDSIAWNVDSTQNYENN